MHIQHSIALLLIFAFASTHAQLPEQGNSPAATAHDAKKVGDKFSKVIDCINKELSAPVAELGGDNIGSSPTPGVIVDEVPPAAVAFDKCFKDIFTPAAAGASTAGATAQNSDAAALAAV